jgi:hypothetical protein
MLIELTSEQIARIESRLTTAEGDYPHYLGYGSLLKALDNPVTLAGHGATNENLHAAWRAGYAEGISAAASNWP